jgi:hypothetical protein
MKHWLLLIAATFYAFAANSQSVSEDSELQPEALPTGSEQTTNNPNEQSSEEAEDDDWRFRVGGYGEMLFQTFNYGRNSFYSYGSDYDKRAEISIPRFVIAMDVKFNDTWTLGSEIEFEYGGAGSAIEYEYNEAGEYEIEIEKGGEVALEQFHITKSFFKQLNLRFGHIIVPFGLTNAHHEPLNFFRAVRSEGESTMIPCTWHENGIELFGTVGKFDYEVMVINGLDPAFFSKANFIQKGKQSMFEKSTMTNPAFAARTDFRFIPNTRIGLSFYGATKTAGNSTKYDRLEKYDVKAPVILNSADVTHQSKWITARANYIWGKIGDAEELSTANLSMPKSGKISIFPRQQVAQVAMDWYAEVGVNVLANSKTTQKLLPFIRYEFYDMNYKTTSSVVKDGRYHRQIYTVGVNYFPLPNLVVKADYSHRQVGSGEFNGEENFSLGVGYIGWYAVAKKHKK